MAETKFLNANIDENTGIAWLTLNRPEKKNALSIALLTEVAAILRSLAENEKIRCIVTTGAGDSFAGGFLGHIARKGNMDFRTMKEAVIYGNVMGSFAVEDFGVRRLLAITKDDVEARYQKYRNLVQF